MKSIYKQNGSILISVLIIMMFFATVTLSLLSYGNISMIRVQGRILALQSQYAAESGADNAIAELNNFNTTYTGTTSEVELIQNANLYRATYEVSVAAGVDSKQKILTATGRVYQPATSVTPKYTSTIEVIAEKSTTTLAASMMSRNIVEIASAVKEIRALDIFANGYIKLHKNSTDLIAENITVAGKETSASNCSLGGSGHLVNPVDTSIHPAFQDPTQTKTNVTVAYNNCLNPGNISDSKFHVMANTPVAKIQSLYIPWSEFMDGSYQNSAGGCNDWTGGGSPHDIPSTGNTKKTHYPDDGSNIEFNCGSAGDVDLGTDTYNLNDHAHIRADFCKSNICKPTFNNPDSTTKFLFVEGTINFEEVTTASGSGPIVMVVYGADPASKTSDCPLGGAVYLGNKGNTATIAPDLFILGMNGVCLDKTKFNADDSLGGLAGKNLYIATNSGTPKDLGFNLDFPVSEIPIDLSWKAAQYRRL